MSMVSKANGGCLGRQCDSGVQKVISNNCHLGTSVSLRPAYRKSVTYTWRIIGERHGARGNTTYLNLDTNGAIKRGYYARNKGVIARPIGGTDSV